MSAFFRRKSRMNSDAASAYKGTRAPERGGIAHARTVHDTMVSEITPLVLTFNERENLPRTLAHLDWASQIVVLDSFSTDETCELARGHPRVTLLQRQF